MRVNVGQSSKCSAAGKRIGMQDRGGRRGRLLGGVGPQVESGRLEVGGREAAL